MIPRPEARPPGLSVARVDISVDGVQMPTRMQELTECGMNGRGAAELAELQLVLSTKDREPAAMYKDLYTAYFISPIKITTPHMACIYLTLLV